MFLVVEIYFLVWRIFIVQGINLQQLLVIVGQYFQLRPNIFAVSRFRGIQNLVGYSGKCV